MMRAIPVIRSMRERTDARRPLNAKWAGIAAEPLLLAFANAAYSAGVTTVPGAVVWC